MKSCFLNEFHHSGRVVFLANDWIIKNKRKCYSYLFESIKSYYFLRLHNVICVNICITFCVNIDLSISRKIPSESAHFVYVIKNILSFQICFIHRKQLHLQLYRWILCDIKKCTFISITYKCTNNIFFLNIFSKKREKIMKIFCTFGIDCFLLQLILLLKFCKSYLCWYQAK